MIDVIQAAADLQKVCQTEGWKFCIIGGLALQRWGEPRFTKDADATIYTAFANEEQYIEKLLANFQPRIADALRFAFERRVLLIQSAKGVGIDVALGGLRSKPPWCSAPRCSFTRRMCLSSRVQPKIWS